MSSHDEFDAFEGAARASLSSRAMAARPAPYLDDLNPAQREAVEALEGPVLMLAGAGTGKTKALTSRIVHLLNSGKAQPNEVLAVTFTNKAAREMKNRVGRMLGHAAEGMPWLGTFHSIGAKMLRQHAELVGLRSDFTILDMDDQNRLLKQLITAGLRAVGVSVDGPEDIHDELRNSPGSWRAAMRALKNCRDAGLVTTSNTQVNNLNWDKLREDDPAEHFAKRQEMKERKEKLDGYKSGIKQQIEAAKSTAQQTAEAERAQSVPEQRQLLAELLPEWKDAKVFAKEKQEIVPYLTDKGFSVEDIREAAHQAPVLALAVKAMRYDRSKRKAAKAKKKVTKAPKMLRPGSDQSATKPKSGKDEKDPVKIMYG